MAFVYWIHLPEHTDMFSEGYIGVTKRTVKERFKEHLECAYKSNSYPIHKAINKYQDRILIDVVIVSNIDYCFWLEKQLRPTSYIGWNIKEGGDYPPQIPDSEETRIKKSLANKGKPKSEEHKNKISISNTGKIFSEERKRNIGAKSLGRKFTEESRSKMRAAHQKNKNKNFIKVLNKYPEIWGMASKIYDLYLAGYSAFKAEKHFELKKSSLNKMIDKFKQSWIPLEDEDWLKIFGKNNGA